MEEINKEEKGNRKRTRSKSARVKIPRSEGED